VQRIGGDTADVAEAARQRAPERVHREPGVVWMRSIPLDEVDAEGRGVCRFELDVPRFRGTLTWVAVTVDGDRYGCTQATTLLSGDLPLHAALPRFVAPGDRVLVPVQIENPTEAPLEVELGFFLEGPVEAVRDLGAEPLAATGAAETAGALLPWRAADPRSDDPRFHAWALRGLVEASAAAGEQGLFGAGLDTPGVSVVTLAPGESARRWFQLELGAGSGRVQGEIAVRGTFSDGRPVQEVFEVDVPVRSGRPLVVTSAVRALAAGEARDFDLARELGFEPTSQDLGDVRVQVSSSFDLGLEPLRRYVLDYPYGCVEQTSSRIWGLLALDDGRSTARFDDGVVDNIEDVSDAIRARVQAGIARLWSMQRPNGGFAYWPRSKRRSRSGRPSSWRSCSPPARTQGTTSRRPLRTAPQRTWKRR
jgi:uncharacterized protein YfaS (alpha-2-macroglobulin family)